ncbi:MAG: M48 family metallopeptidase [Candidatus Gastranaerophilales bacterium]|nr:M48 family metallopeptidase [Candidatus Gastranaerophilales bacterium]
MEQLLSMNDNFEYNEEAAKAIIYEDTNITETNLFRDLFQVCVKLLLILVMIYFSVFLFSGIILKTLSLDQQIKLENFLTDIIDIKTYNLSKEDKYKLLEMKQRILLLDKNYPKTTNLNIEIIDDNMLNALCYPNGTIYITSALYNRIKSDEQMMFVIAHEMAHYKNKDHLMNLRKNIAGGCVVILLSFAHGETNNELITFVDNAIALTDLKFSRSSEEKADIYAGKILLSEYGNINGGLELLNILKEERDLYELEILSTHPLIENRIKKLKRLK